MAAMILYPAIDLKDGQCVRVVRGDRGELIDGSLSDRAKRVASGGIATAIGIASCVCVFFGEKQRSSQSASQAILQVIHSLILVPKTCG